MSVQVGGGKKVHRFVFAGLDIFYNKATLLDFKEEYVFPSSPNDVRTREMMVNGTMMAFSPTTMIKLPADSFVFLIKGGFGYARASINETYTGQDGYWSNQAATISASSSGWALSLGGEMAVPVGSAMFISAEAGLLTTIMGPWRGTASIEGEEPIEGTLMIGDTKPLYDAGLYTLEQTEAVGYWMYLAEGDFAKQLEAMGWQKAKINMGGYALRLGFGFQF